MSRRCLLLLLVAVLGPACSSSTAVVPTKNLDRPTDLGFACLGVVTDASGQSVLSGQPMDACHSRTAVDPIITTNGQRTLGTFAFVPSAGRGELAIADLDYGRLLDLTPQSAGYGMLPIGGDPESLAVSQDGCWIVTANRTSCDFTLVDPGRLLAPTFSSNSSTVASSTGVGDTAHHLTIRTGSGQPLRGSTGEIAFLPPAAGQVCQAGSRPRVVATFPGCDLVALLDLSFDDSAATIASAYYVRPDLPGGFLAAGAEPSCPQECATPVGSDTGADQTDGGQLSPDGSIWGGSPDGGVRGSAVRVQPLTLVPEGTRVYVGALFDSAVTSFEIGDAGLAAPVRIELAAPPIAENPGGVTRLRLGIDPFATGTVSLPDGSTRTVTGQFLRNRGAFLYAFASDDSIRVFNLDGPSPQECDVNIVAPEALKATSCFPVGTPGRRPLARGPGIHIPTFNLPDSPAPTPRDVAFADFQPMAGDANYHALSGQFGFVVASSGQVYVLNLAPNGEDGRSPIPASSCATHLAANAPALPAVATHSFREIRDVGQCARTPLAVSIAPQRSVIQTDQAFATTASLSALQGPRIMSFSTDNGVTTSWIDYPDPDTIISRVWDVVWEGALTGTTRGSGLPRAPADPALAGTLGDVGAEFCASTVREGDILMISGCTQNSDCQPDDTFSCQVSVSGARGMCLPIEASASAALITRCARFMGSRMRYEIARATPNGLDLRLKLDEVPKTSLNPCQTDADCRPDVDHGSLSNGNPDGGASHAFACVEVRPLERRCVERCNPKNGDHDCRSGHVCESVPWTNPDVGPLCVEAPPIDASCFPQPMTAYSVRAGHAFVVLGQDALPSLHTGRVAADGTCAIDATANPSLVNRIPLSAPACPDSFFAQPNAAGGLVQNLSAQAGANPCLYQGVHPDGDSPAASGDHIRAFFQNPQIRFVLTNLDQYAGDLLSIHFQLQYGFIPLTVQISPYEVQLTLGTRILTGPTKTPESPIRRSPVTDYLTFPYVYVVDQGRTALTAGSRGQVLRVNARSGSNEIVTFDTTLSGSTPFQLQ